MKHDATDDEIRELLGAYALGAVTDDERAAVEQMLLVDADARTELHGLEHAVAWLAHASPRPSAAAWDAVAARIADDAVTSRPTTTAGTDEPASLDAHRARTRTSRRSFGPIAIALAVAAVVLAVVLLVRPGEPAPGRTVALRDDGGRTVLVVRVDGDRQGEVVRSELGRAPAGRAFQLWSIPRAGAPVRSAGVLGPAVTAGRRVTVPEDTGQLAVSVEPTGGSPAPTTTPIAAGRVS